MQPFHTQKITQPPQPLATSRNLSTNKPQNLHTQNQATSPQKNNVMQPFHKQNHATSKKNALNKKSLNLFTQKN